MKTPDKSRKDFEAWATSKGFQVDRWPEDSRWPNQYVASLQLAYEAWQQSALLAGKDGERLDWLHNNTGTFINFYDKHCGNVREAIDAAIKQSNE